MMTTGVVTFLTVALTIVAAVIAWRKFSPRYGDLWFLGGVLLAMLGVGLAYLIVYFPFWERFWQTTGINPIVVSLELVLVGAVIVVRYDLYLMRMIST